MNRHHPWNYCIIRVTFWSFPYLLWQAFGHWSGFFAGVIVALLLTRLFDELLCANSWQATEPQAPYQGTEK